MMIKKHFYNSTLTAFFFLLLMVLLSSASVAVADINNQVAQLDFDTATLDDVIAIFGEPTAYKWGDQTYDRQDLPVAIYGLWYPDGFFIVMTWDSVYEVRFESSALGYVWICDIEVDSSLDDVLDVTGPPSETIIGDPMGCEDGVLYKDINGIAGYCSYRRSDFNVRFFFFNYRVIAIYLTGNPPTSHELAINSIKHTIAEKLEILGRIDTALEEEEDTYNTIEELLDSRDYGDLKKGDLIKAKQKIHSAIQHQEQSKHALEKSIEKLEDALEALGYEPPPNLVTNGEFTGDEDANGIPNGWGAYNNNPEQPYAISVDYQDGVPAPSGHIYLDIPTTSWTDGALTQVIDVNDYLGMDINISFEHKGDITAPDNTIFEYRPAINNNPSINSYGSPIIKRVQRGGQTNCWDCYGALTWDWESYSHTMTVTDRYLHLHFRLCGRADSSPDPQRFLKIDNVVVTPDSSP